ncbi:glutathione peroxidase [Thalassotalea aquiviva]|uniref:glutathione peroxidase n=1 Tax=Thalassotalea aquiviva TaxID=3242415 RepID=UPI00352A9284
MTNIYQFNVTKNSGESVSLSQYEDQVVLIVNTASACGFTPQYQGLESLYQKYQDKGLRILAFPCNQFGQQEKGSDSEIKHFCDLNFQISFELFAKIDVNGNNADPLFVYLSDQARGLLGSKKIKWNFTKFLVNKQGQVVKRYGSMTKPEQLENDILSLL